MDVEDCMAVAQHIHESVEMELNFQEIGYDEVWMYALYFVDEEGYTIHLDFCAAPFSWAPFISRIFNTLDRDCRLVVNCIGSDNNPDTFEAMESLIKDQEEVV